MRSWVLVTLRRREVLHLLHALERMAALLRPHAVQVGEGIAHALLDLGRLLAEARLLLERSLLLFGGEVAVALHPLLEMLPLRWVAVLLSHLHARRHLYAGCHLHAGRDLHARFRLRHMKAATSLGLQHTGAR